MNTFDYNQACESRVNLAFSITSMKLQIQNLKSTKTGTKEQLQHLDKLQQLQEEIEEQRLEKEEQPSVECSNIVNVQWILLNGQREIFKEMDVEVDDPISYLQTCAKESPERKALMEEFCSLVCHLKEIASQQNSQPERPHDLERNLARAQQLNQLIQDANIPLQPLANRTQQIMSKVSQKYIVNQQLDLSGIIQEFGISPQRQKERDELYQWWKQHCNNLQQQQQQSQQLQQQSQLQQDQSQRQQQPLQQQSQRQSQLQQDQSQRQQQPLHALSQVSNDDIILFKLANDRGLKTTICRKLPMSRVLKSIGKKLPKKLVEDIENCSRGKFSAAKKFLHFAATKKFEDGWSDKLLEACDQLKLNELKKMLTPNKEDLDNFIQSRGVSDHSLLGNISKVQRNYCRIHYSPFGKKKSADESERIPIVHPQLLGSIKLKKTNPVANTRRRHDVETNLISFDDMIGSNHQSPKYSNEVSNMIRNEHAISLFLVGRPGSGKSTLGKRMVKAYNEDNKIAFYIPLQMVDHNQNWNLKNLLLKFPILWHENKTPGAEKIDRDFELMVANQGNCLIVFDGLDEIEFQIADPPVEANINDELPLGVLISLILSKRFLSATRIVTACRPHTQTQLADSVEPDFVVFISELPEFGLQTLMKHYFPSEDVESLLKELVIKSPQIYQLIRTPLFLQLFVMLHHESDERIWTINTTAKLFSETIKIHQDCAHFNRQDMISDLDFKLGKIAYEKTMIHNSTIFDESDLEGFSASDVQDFMFSFVRKFSNTSSTVKSLMFHHLSVQEYLSAEFAMKRLDFDHFKDFVKKIFPEISKNEAGWLEFNEDPFSNVRVFSMGLLNEIYSEERINFFVDLVCTHISQLFTTKTCNFTGPQQETVMKNLMELRSGGILTRIREQLKSVEFVFSGCFRNLELSDAFYHFVNNFVTKVEEMTVFESPTFPDNIKKLSEEMQMFKGKIHKLCINLHSLRSVDVKEIVALFPKVTGYVQLYISNHVPREFWEALDAEIQRFDTTTLQVQVLQLYLRHTGEGHSQGYLHGNLVRGEIPKRLEGTLVDENLIFSNFWGTF